MQKTKPSHIKKKLRPPISQFAEANKQQQIVDRLVALQENEAMRLASLEKKSDYAAIRTRRLEWVTLLVAVLSVTVSLLGLRVAEKQAQSSNDQLELVKEANREATETRDILLRQAKATESAASTSTAQAKSMALLKSATETQAQASSEIANSTSKQLEAIRMTAKATETQANASRSSAIATRELAESARDQINLVAAANRPWVGTAMYGNNPITEVGADWVAYMQVTNNGNSSARSTDINMYMQVISAYAPQITSAFTCQPSCYKYSINKGQTLYIHAKLPKEQMTAENIRLVMEKKVVVYLIFAARYQDDGNNIHYTTACHVYNVQSRSFNTCAFGNDQT